MLISNKSKVLKTLHLELYYDDGTEKKTDLKEGQEIYLVFRRNHKVNVEYGKVEKIIERYFNRLANNMDGETTPHSESAIVFDMSKQYDSNKYTIPITDIIDFELVIPDINPGPMYEIPLIVYDRLHKE